MRTGLSEYKRNYANTALKTQKRHKVATQGSGMLMKKHREGIVWIIITSAHESGSIDQQKKS